MESWMFPLRSHRTLEVLLLVGMYVLSLPGPSFGYNVILLIGDGMGIAQIACAQYASVGPDGNLAMQRLPELGLTTVHPLDVLNTDSAAAGTALATGHKTQNGRVSMLPDGREIQTILEYAQGLGMRTGLVTTAWITHATPAVFAAHTRSRNNWEEIIDDYLTLQPDVLLGGGVQYWIPKGVDWDGDGCSDSKRMDKRDRREEAKALGYIYVETAVDLAAVYSKTTSKLLGLFSISHMDYELDRQNTPSLGPGGRRGTQPSIWEMTSRALDMLEDDPDGFFLMVEGARIDHAGHSNDRDRIIWDTIAFDKAVKVAVDFAEEKGNTLVIVTADHECGGLVPYGDFDGVPDYQDNDGDGFPDSPTPSRPLKVVWGSSTHTAVHIPVMAMGPNADLFNGYFDNTYLFEVMGRTLVETTDVERSK